MKTKRITELDAIRGAACLFVLLFHVSNAWGAVVPIGRLGVLYFFVLSGYVMPHVYFDQWERDHSVKFWVCFYTSRIARLLPTHIIVYLSLYLPFWLNNTPMGDSTPVSAQMVVFQTFLLGFAVDANATIWIGPTWTLFVEFAFYASLPVVFYLITKAAYVLLYIGVSIHFLSLGLMYTGVISASSFLHQLPTFMIGMGIQRMIVHEQVKEWLNDTLVSTIIFYLLVILSCVVSLSVGATPCLLPVAVQIYIAVHGKVRWLDNQAVQFLGSISYPLYLVHWPLLFLMPVQLVYPSSTFALMVYLVLTFLFAYILHWIAEVKLYTFLKSMLTDGAPVEVEQQSNEDQTVLTLPKVAL